MRTDVTWDNGGAAELLSFKNDWLTVLSNTPQAPGKPWRGALAAGAFVGLKVKSCNKKSCWTILQLKLAEARDKTVGHLAVDMIEDEQLVVAIQFGDVLAYPCVRMPGGPLFQDG